MRKGIEQIQASCEANTPTFERQKIDLRSSSSSALDSSNLTMVKANGGGSDSSCSELEELQKAASSLEMALDKMNSPTMERPSGLGMVPTTHEAVFGHSRFNPPRARFVWIMKASTVNKDDSLGFSPTQEEIRKFGSQARKVFLRKPPSQLQKSFTCAVMSWEGNRPPKRPWTRRGEEDRAGPQDRSVDERDPRAKH
jgi:hypothetical protein